MAIDIHPDAEAGRTQVRISAEMNIYTAATLRDALLAQSAEAFPRHLDLSQVSEMDTAGLQLLLAALRPARPGAAPGCIAACSPAVGEFLDLCGLGHLRPDAASACSGAQ